MMLIRGVLDPLGEEDPERADVPTVGRRLEIMPVVVRWRERVGVGASESYKSRGYYMNTMTKIRE